MEPDDLYGLGLDDFTAERDRLVKRLRDEDRRKEAAAVGRLRKPTTDAWALNQVARREPDLVQRLLQTHQELRDASGGDAFRRAAESRNRLLDELIGEAASVLEEAGHSSEGPVRDRITRTLLAAAGDPDTESALQRGTLTRAAEVEAQWAGVSFPSAAGDDGDDDELDEAARQEELDLLEARAQELAEKAEDLRRVADKAREALDEARREANAAEDEARSAQKAAREARREADRRRGSRSRR